MAMASLAHQKCLNHAGREAIARCPRCRSNFCRECVSEHQGRILCAPCLAKEAARAQTESAGRFWVPIGSVAGLAVAWLFFVAMGKGLLAIPASFHDGGWAEQAAESLQGDGP